MRCVEVKFCEKKYFNCDVEIFRFRRNIAGSRARARVCVCVVKYFNCAVEMLWLALKDQCAGLLRDGSELFFRPDIIPSG